MTDFVVEPHPFNVTQSAKILILFLDIKSEALWLKTQLFHQCNISVLGQIMTDHASGLRKMIGTVPALKLSGYVVILYSLNDF